MKISELCQNMKLPPPQIIEYAGGIQVTLFNSPSTGDKSEATGDKSEATGDKSEATGDKSEATGDKSEATGDKENLKREIVKFIEQRTEVKASDIQSQFNYPKNSSWIRELLSELVAENVLEAVGDKKARKYRIK